jgi:hypothetical protein
MEWFLTRESINKNCTIMKYFIVLMIFIFIGFALLAQEEVKPEVWQYKDAELMIGTEDSDTDYYTEGRLIQIIPTGKRRQSYVFVFGIMEDVRETMRIDDGNESESVSFSKKVFTPIEFEIWADDGGDNLLEYLQCNPELPDMFNSEEDAEKYNSLEFQPCIGSNVKLKAKVSVSEDVQQYFLLEVEKLD